jgi:hypothetical protein
MSIDENNDSDQIKNSLKKINEDILKFSTILEKFGLDLITKLGQTNLRVKILTDKVDVLHKTTIDIKSLLPQLNKIIESQSFLESEVDLIKSLLQKAVSSYSQENLENDLIQRDLTATEEKKSIYNHLNSLKEKINDYNDALSLKEVMSNLKEKIFEFTGGHPILYEMSQTINQIGENKSLTKDMKEKIKEKVGFWINKL